MTATTISDKEFEQDFAKAKEVAKNGPVFIAENGLRAYVLVSIEQFYALSTQSKTLVDALAMPGVEEIDIEFSRIGDEFPIAPDLS